MKFFVPHPKYPVKYNKVFRTYYIELFNQPNIITLDYCPWCGVRLPKELTNEFFATLENEYKIETNMGEYKDTSLPDEFRTDVWWKKRGLLT